VRGGEIDVAIDDILHARLRLAHIVNTTAYHEWLLDAVCSLHCYGIANARSSQPGTHHASIRISPVAGGHAPAFGTSLADADVAVVVDRQTGSGYATALDQT
jgi:hypothetical protein